MRRLDAKMITFDSISGMRTIGWVHKAEVWGASKPPGTHRTVDFGALVDVKER